MNMDVLYMKIDHDLNYWEKLKALYKENGIVKGSIIIYGKKKNFKKHLLYVKNILKKHIGIIKINKITRPKKTPISPDIFEWKIYFSQVVER